MRTTARAVFAAGLPLLAMTLAVPAPDGAASPRSSSAVAASPATRGELSVSPEYVQRVNYALRQGDDHWGEKLLKLPDGPSYENTKNLLTPLQHAGPTEAESEWGYVPLTYPAPDPERFLAERDFSLHTTDGSELMAQWSDQRGRQRVVFDVGAARERYGSAESRLDVPELDGGYRPGLINSYTDADGVRYDRESFVTRLRPDGPLVSMIRFTADPEGSAVDTGHVGITINGDGSQGSTYTDGRIVQGDKTVLATSLDGTWSTPSFSLSLDLRAGPTSVYLIVPNGPQQVDPTVRPSAGAYAEAKAAMRRYWDGLLEAGATIDVPERQVMDAMRSTVLNNLVMGFNLTIGNDYEKSDDNFAWVPEVNATVDSLGDYGFETLYGKNIRQLMRRGQGAGTSATWERGIKLQAASQHYWKTGDRGVVEQMLPRFTEWLDDFSRQRDEDPFGLLSKTRYGTDIPDPVYGVHHQAEAWRGMRDLGMVLRETGDTVTAARFLDEARELREALLEAVRVSASRLDDGSLFVPIELRDDNAPEPFELAAATTSGSYWNLSIHYALATGIFPPGSAEAVGIARYLEEHGTLVSGLTRFNLSGSDPGVCQTGQVGNFPATAPGYRSSGIDEQYAWSRIRFDADRQASDRLVMNLYGKLAHDLSPHTFLGGEGTTVAPCPMLGDYYRSSFWAPLSPNNATYLEALRSLLVHERLDETGRPRALDLAPSTPVGWLETGQKIRVASMPTLFGELTYTMESHLDRGYVTARVEPLKARPHHPEAKQVAVHLRVPAGNVLTRVTVNGRAVPFDRQRQTVVLDSAYEPSDVRGYVTKRPVHGVTQAEVIADNAQRMLAEPGESIRVPMQVEALGRSRVTGTIETRTPPSWRTTVSPRQFAVDSDGVFAWYGFDHTVGIPLSVVPGDYTIRMVARPNGGSPTVTELPITVANPAEVSYPTLVRQSDPVGYWRMSDSDQRLEDSSGNGNHGAYRFEVHRGVDGAIADDPDTAVAPREGYAEIPDSESLSVTGPYTLEAWVSADTARERPLIEKYDGGDCLPSRNGYILRLGNGNKLQTVNVADQGSAGEPSKDSLQPGQWHHVASVYDGSRLQTYLDGRLQSSAVVDKAPTDGRGSLKLGARGDDAATRMIEGELDEVAIYGRALTAEELESHYVKGILGNPNTGASDPVARQQVGPAGRASSEQSGARAEPASASYPEQVLALAPVGYWRLGEASGTRAADASGRDNHGSYVEGVRLGLPGALTGDQDTAAELTGGYASAPDTGSLSVTGRFTLEAWVNLDDVCNQYSVIEKYDVPAFNGFGLRVTPSGRLNAFTLGHDGSVGSVDGRSIVTPDQWHHVVAVYDGATISVYLDGRLDGSTATAVNPTDGAAGLKVGARGDDAGTRLAGGIDEVAVYDRALTPAQIEEHYAAANPS